MSYTHNQLISTLQPNSHTESKNLSLRDSISRNFKGLKDRDSHNGLKIIKQFESKFHILHNTLLDKNQQSVKLMEYNNKLSEQIHEEIQMRFQTLTKLINQAQDLKEMNEQLNDKSHIMNMNYVAYKEEISQKDGHIQTLNDEIKRSLEILANDIKKTDTIQRDIYNSQNEYALLEKKIPQLQEYIMKLDKEIMQINGDIKDTQQKIKELINEINELDLSISKATENETQQQENMKDHINYCKDELKKNEKIGRKKDLEEKQLKKLEEELASKIKRLEIVLVSNQKNEKKIEEYNQLKAELEQLIQQNELMANENEDLKIQLGDNIDPNILKNSTLAYRNTYKKMISQNSTHNNHLRNMDFTKDSNLSLHKANTPKSSISGKRFSENSTSFSRKSQTNNTESFYEKPNENKSERAELIELEKLIHENQRLKLRYKRLNEEYDNTGDMINLHDNQINTLWESIQVIDQNIMKYANENITLKELHKKNADEIDNIQAKYNETLNILPEHVRENLIDTDGEEEPLSLYLQPIPSRHNDPNNHDEFYLLFGQKDLDLAPSKNDIISERPLADYI